MDNLGYCCICNTLRKTKPSVFTSRSIIKRKFTDILRDERALANVHDLYKILQWNQRNNIKVFRISSELFPRATCPDFGYNLYDISIANEVKKVLKQCGDFAYIHGHKLSFHPGPYTCIASPNPKVRDASLRELEMHSTICDMIDPNDNLDIPINIHVGGSYGKTYHDTAARFIEAFRMLSPNAQRRLVLENDDKKNGWSVNILVDKIYTKINTPVTFDIHHHKFCDGGLDSEFAFKLAAGTWGDRSMQIHYSESRNPDILVTAHSDYYSLPIPKYITEYKNCHIHLECKQKELALLKYRRDFS